ncbi:lovastatin nonaketide synthase [Pyricularia oryzae 70-15]|uniref:Lovastatin nonaketide synthase n=3 Tax=Pyricularia oryzae TaxID=318829 RepID=G4NDV1_PYRO7|nr:lovastatin nonaketide synthase [Pyricularia oryzae 70-15]EHA49333.1 lovastatin nonaketide synthase [Pyricularia oryzae 70-15]ELQ34140.1 lovastatin nonaketide synthase [Pyricularia oryzae Y34]KAI7919300.1 lovastatin nonaketide synthase [Pyricularia oryzae]
MSYSIPPNEPVAVVGSSCRFAGGVSKPSELWELLKNPQDLSQTIPPSRFSATGFFHEDGEYHGTTNSTKAYFVQGDHRAFDASFFNIAPKEAEAIDPQQRMLLETVYESLESAGYTLKQFSGEKVSVFSGVMTADYDTLCQRDDITSSQYFATGNARSTISNRLSYFFNFCGPSMTIDTACSASLVALHQAVQSLRSGESIMACVTGSNLILTPEQFITESSLHMLSPTGLCRMWDTDANGYARGEGVAALLLKPLSKALADGDTIQAIIRETGVNSDGRTQGITMPNPLAQAALIRETYQKTGLDPTDASDRCQYFEAHGTGTQAGDPREAQAIADAFFPSNVTTQDPTMVAKSKLLVGSVKTVIGHTEGAAGLAGTLKVIQAMRNKTVPPNMHLRKVNPKVEPFYKHLEIPTSCTDWPAPASGHPLRASVNSFGFGGTNSHAIVELYTSEIHDPIGKHFAEKGLAVAGAAAGSESSVVEENKVDVQLPLVLSAASKKTLYQVASAFKDFMSLPDIQEKLSNREELNKLLHLLLTNRSPFPYRLSVTGATCQDLMQALEKAIDGIPAGGPQEIGALALKQIAKGPLKILGIFTGQGAQWAQMSKHLLINCPIFKQTIHQLEDVLRECPTPPDWTISQELSADAENSRINIAAISQPLCTAVQIALVNVLRAIGINFHTVVGHSSGEVAAAYAAGRITAPNAILIAYYRGLYAHVAGAPGSGVKGGMLAAGLSKLEAERLCALDNWRGRLSAAASNSHTSVTLSGDLDAVKEMAQYLTEQGKFARKLIVDTAYHSAHMLAPAEKYGESLSTFEIEASEGNSTKWISSVYGDDRILELGELKSTYWTDNMVKPVLFREAIESAVSGNNLYDVAVEVGPHPALKGPATETIKAATGSTIPYFGVLDRKKNDMVALSDFIGSMWTSFDHSAVRLPVLPAANSFSTSPQQSWSEKLPQYPWDHSQIHYRESRISQQYHFRADPPHELLGVRTRDDTEFELRWRNIIKLETVPWIEHHCFQGQALLPASAYCVMALDAARVLLKGRDAMMVELENLEFLSGMTVEAGNYGVETLFTLTVLPPSKDHQDESTITANFTLTSAYADGSSPMRMNFRGSMTITLGAPSSDALPFKVAIQPETTSVSPEGFYQMMKDLDLEYTGPFQGIKTIDRRYNFATTTLLKSHPDDTTSLAVSPATLDTCFQACFSAFASPGDGSLWTTFLPTFVSAMRFNMAVCDLKDGQDQTIKVDASLTEFKPTSKNGAATINADMAIYNDQGQAEIQIECMTVASFAATKAEDDYELYLHTVTQLDPEDAIVGPQAPLDVNSPEFRSLVESCDRVAAFFCQDYKSWPRETKDGLKAFVKTSPHSAALELLMQLGKNLPHGVLQAMAAPVVQESLDMLSMQRQVSAIVGQVAHRYPRMKVLVVTEPGLGLKEHVLAGLNSSFTSLTVAGKVEPSFEQRVLHAANDAVRDRIFTKSLDNEDEKWDKHDLVVVSTAVGGDSVALLKRMHALMNPGAYLVLVDMSLSPLRERLRRCSGQTVDSSSNITPPDYPDVLEECGFVNASKNGDQQHIPGFSITVRQTESPLKDVLRAPLSGGPGSPSLTSKLLVIGGSNNRTTSLMNHITTGLEPFCERLVSAKSFEDADHEDLATCTAAIVLADLDAPVLSTMTAARLESIRTLMRPETTVLWITYHSRDSNPEHAATFGFARTLLAEIPNLNLQLLDLEVLNGAGQIINENFGRLCQRKLTTGEGRKMLWTHEPEIHIEKGRRLVPRVLPYRPAIDRVNAPRRVITSTVNTTEQCVDIVPVAAAPAGATQHEIKLHSGIVSTGHMAKPNSLTHPPIQVLYSSSQPIDVGTYKGYLCFGRELSLNGKGRSVVLFSDTNASMVQPAPGQVVFDVPETTVTSAACAAWALRTLAVMACMDKPQGGTIILVEPDMCLYTVITQLFTSSQYQICVFTSDRAAAMANPGWTFVHRYQSRAPIEHVFARMPKFSVYNFLDESSPVSALIRGAIASRGDYYPGGQLLKYTITEMRNCDLEDVIEFADMKSLQIHPSCDEPVSASAISVPSLLDSTSPAKSPFQVVDWRAERDVSYLAPPVVGTSMLSPDKTYLLVGITRDLGQSLCQLLAEQGARHIVLSSRSPPDNAQTVWRHELRARTGCTVLMEKLDVTDRASVLALKARLTSTCPPVGGVVNGAMVLDDRVFAQMSIETLQRVMRPKTVGSSNLDAVFDSPDLDFFIMTSSFAAIGGHAGQSNYAAANMYMNGLAADRRRRGLAASVLNIGVIYGLGFLHREKDDLYASLEREGYPPISERDVHHMFLEAMAAGKPSARKPGAAVADLTTGLSRYNMEDAEPLHWHRDPRFSHYTIQQAGRGIGSAKAAGDRQSIKDQVELAQTAAEVQQVVAAGLEAKLRKMLQLREGAPLDMRLGLSDIGVDSLAANEIRSWVFKNVGKDVGVMKILGAASVDKLCEEIAGLVVAARN